MLLGIIQNNLIPTCASSCWALVFAILTATPMTRMARMALFGPYGLEILVALMRHNVPATLRFVEHHPDEEEEIEEVHTDGSIKLSLIQPNTQKITRKSMYSMCTVHLGYKVYGFVQNKLKVSGYSASCLL